MYEIPKATRTLNALIVEHNSNMRSMIRIPKATSYEVHDNKIQANWIKSIEVNWISGTQFVSCSILLDLLEVCSSYEILNVPKYI